MKKEMSELFRTYLIKNNVISKKDIKKDKDIQKIILKAMIKSFKGAETQKLSDFGYFKKTSKMINSKVEKTINFIPNDDSQNKIKKKFVIHQKELNLVKFPLIKIIIITLVILLIICAFIFGFTVISKTINNYNQEKQRLINSKNKDNLNQKDTTGDSFSNVIADSTSDNIADNTADINYNLIKTKTDKDQTSDTNKNQLTTSTTQTTKVAVKEKIDFTDKEIKTNENKSIIIKTQAVNDTKLKEGEYSKELVDIDGKVYDKYIYIIKEGDTLWWIADKFLLNPFLWPNIHKDNPYIVNPNLIEPNYKLTIYTQKTKE
ncbi:MAG: hypothetical protein A2086_01915 [Spirochaetes bacterium GWD1_27_9]|nr:MAG: hypothetical protein A2Y34_10510 [Spirochaetes bacterium GWC1_27_15]OHD41617.1 MAG: hypothetical protein A2086_01915 [Spirochaetes bacterium GWD1_27_9]